VAEHLADLPTACRLLADAALRALLLVATQVLSFPLIVSDNVALGHVSTVAFFARLCGLVTARAVVNGSVSPRVSGAVLGAALSWLLLMSSLLVFLARRALEGRPLPQLQVKVRRPF
jgi:hypothetical protein